MLTDLMITLTCAAVVGMLGYLVILARRLTHTLAQGAKRAEGEGELAVAHRDLWAQHDQLRRDSEAQYRMLTEHSRDIVAMHDANCRATFVSPAVLRILGYFPDQLVGHRPAEYVHPEDLPALTAAMESCRTVGGRAQITVRMRARAGHHVWMETLVQSVYDDDGRFLHLTSTSRDISDRHRAEEELQRHVAILRGVAEGTPDALFVRHRDGTYEFTNPAAAHLLQQTTDQFLDGTSPPDGDLVGHLLGLSDPALLESEGTIQRERQLAVDGTTRTFQVRTTPRRNAAGQATGIVAIVSDVTEQVRLETESRHRQKMEAVGQLAGGIAHDFNNLLTVICGYADLLAQGVEPESPHKGFVQEIRSAARMAATLTQRLLTFSRKHITRMGPLDVNSTVVNLQPILRSMIGEAITLDLALTERVPAVLADQNQLEQAIINLVLNAKDALPRGGTVRIESTFIPPPPAGRRGRGEDPRFEGGEVRLSVVDNGTGIEPGIVDRIFEPFFTTKTPGKGTGLGLSTVYGIVTQAGGAVSVESTVGHGSVFTISLPPTDRIHETSGPSSTYRRTPTGSETVLVVEDESAVRQLAQRVFSAAGYTVITARHGADALRVAESHPGRIDLVVTDIAMPVMDGPALVRELRRRNIVQAALFMSGYSDEELLDGALNAGEAFVAKPVGGDALLVRAREVLEGLARPAAA